MATKIQVLRWERDLTLEKLAKNTKIGIMTLCFAEGGKKKTSKKTQYFLSQYLGVPESELFLNDKAIEA